MPRPQLRPTPEQRGIVKSMAAVGIPHADIARKIGIRSEKTLRKHFREELDLGRTEADYKVAKTFFELATSGACPSATIHWAKSRLGFRERTNEGQPPVPSPFIVAQDLGGSHAHA